MYKNTNCKNIITKRLLDDLDKKRTFEDVLKEIDKNLLSVQLQLCNIIKYKNQNRGKNWFIRILTWLK